MEDMRVIPMQVEPTEWVNSLVTVVKPNGKLCVCLDPRDLNKILQKEHYPMNTIEKVATYLSDVTCPVLFQPGCQQWVLAVETR